VNLGYRPSSLFGEEFLSTPIHSPLSGRLIGSSPPSCRTRWAWSACTCSRCTSSTPSSYHSTSSCSPNARAGSRQRRSTCTSWRPGYWCVTSGLGLVRFLQIPSCPGMHHGQDQVDPPVSLDLVQFQIMSRKQFLVLQNVFVYTGTIPGSNGRIGTEH
jgi:hypothetical protein